MFVSCQSSEELPLTSSTIAAAVIYAKDLARLRRFYEGLAGLVITEQGEGYVVLEATGFQLSLVAMPEYIAAATQIAEPPRRREQVPVKLVYFVPSLDVLREQIPALGGGLNPVEREWLFQGARVCDGHDPEGNIFQLRERPMS